MTRSNTLEYTEAVRGRYFIALNNEKGKSHREPVCTVLCLVSRQPTMAPLTCIQKAKPCDILRFAGYLWELKM